LFEYSHVFHAALLLNRDMFAGSKLDAARPAVSYHGWSRRPTLFSHSDCVAIFSARYSILWRFAVFGALLRLLIVATGFYWVTSSTSVDRVLSMLAGTAIVCVVVAAMA